jgi:hypothetical protein
MRWESGELFLRKGTIIVARRGVNGVENIRFYG